MNNANVVSRMGNPQNGGPDLNFRKQRQRRIRLNKKDYIYRKLCQMLGELMIVLLKVQRELQQLKEWYDALSRPVSPFQLLCVKEI